MARSPDATAVADVAAASDAADERNGAGEADASRYRRAASRSTGEDNAIPEAVPAAVPVAMGEDDGGDDNGHHRDGNRNVAAAVREDR